MTQLAPDDETVRGARARLSRSLSYQTSRKFARLIGCPKERGHGGPRIPKTLGWIDKTGGRIKARGEILFCCKDRPARRPPARYRVPGHYAPLGNGWVASGDSSERASGLDRTRTAEGRRPLQVRRMQHTVLPARENADAKKRRERKRDDGRLVPDGPDFTGSPARPWAVLSSLQVKDATAAGTFPGDVPARRGGPSRKRKTIRQRGGIGC